MGGWVGVKAVLKIVYNNKKLEKKTIHPFSVINKELFEVTKRKICKPNLFA